MREEPIGGNVMGIQVQWGEQVVKPFYVRSVHNVKVWDVI